MGKYLLDIMGQQSVVHRSAGLPTRRQHGMMKLGLHMKRDPAGF